MSLCWLDVEGSTGLWKYFNQASKMIKFKEHMDGDRLFNGHGENWSSRHFLTNKNESSHLQMLMKEILSDGPQKEED